MRAPNFLSNVALDRAAHRRQDSAWIAARLERPESRLVPVWRNRSFLAGAEGARAGSIPAPHHAELTGAGQPVFLGLLDDVAYFAVDVAHVDDPAAHPLLAGGRFADLRRLMPLWAQVGAGAAEAAEANVLAHARAMIHWHAQHRHCGACGAPTRSEAAGHRLACTSEACGQRQFPRTDTAMIVLVHDGRDRALLGRAPSFPPGMRSILAGFQEPGESLEDTVAREVLEEVGVPVTDIAYHSSQPWPFPGALMVGFTARATALALQVDAEELEDAAWYDRAAVRDMSRSEAMRIPPRVSLAGRLIREWLDG